jgi:hypothetical protein
MLPTDALNFLTESGASHLPHSGRTLQVHLLGTWHLLKSWGSSDTVCLGGLFHSVYGTNIFSKKCLAAADRPKLQSAIGRDAESLAWLFCNIDRPKAILQGLEQFSKFNKSACADQADRCIELACRREHGGATHLRDVPLLVTSTQLNSLAQIECANLIEQGGWSSSLRDLYCAVLEHPVLNKAATSALQSAWISHVRQR